MYEIIVNGPSPGGSPSPTPAPRNMRRESGGSATPTGVFLGREPSKEIGGFQVVATPSARAGDDYFETPVRHLAGLTL